MLATNNPILSHAPRSFGNPDPELDRHLLAGALSALSTLAVLWLRRNGAPPSQEHWEAIKLAQVDGEVSRAR